MGFRASSLMPFNVGQWRGIAASPSRRTDLSTSPRPLNLDLNAAARIENPAREIVLVGQPEDERPKADALDDALNGYML